VVHDCDTIVVYKIDRLTRSLADFAKIVKGRARSSRDQKQRAYRVAGEKTDNQSKRSDTHRERNLLSHTEISPATYDGGFDGSRKRYGSKSDPPEPVSWMWQKMLNCAKGAMSAL
jgi:hypothetical protein